MKLQSTLKGQLFLFLMLFVFACKESETEIAELTIKKIENSIDINSSTLNLKSTITFNRSPDVDDKIYYELKQNGHAGNSSVISENVVELNISVEEPSRLLSFTPQVETTSGVRIKGEPINLSYTGNGDYWLELKRFPIQSNTESSIPFVFGDKVYFAGLGNFQNSTHGYSYELDMASLTFEKKDYMPIPTFRKYGFQLGENAYIGECLRVTKDNTSSCSSESVTYKYNSTSKKWTQNSDTVEWSLAFGNERHVGFILENKAYNYYTYSGNIHVFDEINNNWNLVSNTENFYGSPWAEVINSRLYLGSFHSGAIKELDVETGNVTQSYSYPIDPESSQDYAVHSFALNEKIYIQFAGHDDSFNFYFDTRSKKWDIFAPAPKMNTDFFMYDGSIYKTSQGLDHSFAGDYFTSIWKYFPN